MYTEAYRISYLAIKYRVGAVWFFFFLLCFFGTERTKSCLVKLF